MEGEEGRDREKERLFGKLNTHTGKLDTGSTAFYLTNYAGWDKTFPQTTIIQVCS